MTATYGVPIAARIPQDLKDAARAAVTGGAWEDLSTIVRLGTAIALRLGHDEAGNALARLEKGEELLARSGTAHRLGHATERLAADRAGRRAGAARLEVLDLANRAGDHGITADEVVAELGHKWAPNGLPRRVTDLVQTHALEQQMLWPTDAVVNAQVDRNGNPAPRTRATRTGSPANVYVITDQGRAALAAGRAPGPPKRKAAA